MRRALALFAGLTAAGLTAGCPDRSISEVAPIQGRVEFKNFPVKQNRDVDLLFVIDNSPSMADKQTNLVANFQNFIDVLQSIQGGLPNLHLAVVTSDMGTVGAVDGTPGPTIPGQMGQCVGAGNDGIMRTSPMLTMGHRFIADLAGPDGMRLPPNYSGTLAEAFSSLATVGDTGCGFEQHLEAMRAALSPGATPSNAGFLRPNAFLAVVFIADEDDCSISHSTGERALLADADPGRLGNRQSFRCTRWGITCDTNGATPNAMNTVGAKGRCHPNTSDDDPFLVDVQRYVEFLKGLKDDPSKVIVAGVMGPTEPFAVELRTAPNIGRIPALAHSCSYTGNDGKPQVADPPIRLRTFLDQFPNRNTFASICQRDLSGGLRQIGDLLKTVIGNPCIEGKLADIDPGPEVLYDCSVASSVTFNGVATETLMPRCPGENGQPCWELVVDPIGCPAGDHRKIGVQREDLLQDANVIANCVTEVGNASE